MISFKQFMLEKAMNQKVFADTASRLGDTARVGYEFEMAIPSSSGLYSGDRDTDNLRDYDDYMDVKEWFDISSHDERAIDREFDEWKEEQKKEYVDDNFDNFLNDEGDDEDDAREKAGRFYDSTEDHAFSEFLDDVYRGKLSRLLDAYSCPPTHGWHDEASGEFYTSEIPDNFDEVAKNCKASLERQLEEPVEIHGYPDIDNEIFSITSDSSIEGDAGIELVTPPSILSKSLDHVDTICKWMKWNDAETNSSTGLHINISLPNLKDNVDPLKLLLFMGEKFISSEFGRSNNSYAAQHLPKLIDYINQGKSIPATEKELLGDSWKLLKMNAKYMTVNFGKLSSGYLEFRAPGGRDYHYYPEKIKETTLRMVTALEIACDPKAERNLYIKKIYQLFGNIDKTAEINARGLMNLDIAKPLHRVYSYDHTHLNPAIKDYNDTLTNGSKFNQIESLIILINTCRNILGRVRKTLDEKERAYFKKEAKRIGMTSKDVDEFYSDAPSNREPFRKDVGL